MNLSPDEGHLYALGYNSSGVIELTRAGDGSLTPSSTARGCYSQIAATLCQTGDFIGNNRQVVVSPDGRFVYTVGDFSRLNVFKRDANPPVCQDGSATIGAGQSIVLNLPCTDDSGYPMEIAIVTPPNGGSIGSVDQAAKQVSFAAFSGFSGTTSFTFRATSNGVSSATKTFTINVLPPGCTIAGTAGNDVLVGTAGRDLICGLGGNDTIKGLGGNDTLKGAGGKDKLIGGGGNDTLLGGAGNDTLTGSAGKDVLKGQGGADLLLGGAGNNTLTGSGGKDVLKGQGGADLLLAKDRVKDTVNGGPGKDRAKTDRIDRKYSIEKLI